MPVLKDIKIALDLSSLPHSQGMGTGARQNRQFMEMSRQLAEMVESECLIQPAAAWETYRISSIERGEIKLETGGTLKCRLPRSLSGSKEIAVAVYSIGHALEERAAGLFRQKEPLKGTLLDGIGNGYLDVLEKEVCRMMGKEAAGRGYKTSRAFPPGSKAFPISEQFALFRLVPAEEAGVSLTANAIMSPRKSSSAIFAFGEEMPESGGEHECSQCNMAGTCPYRQV